MISGTIRLMLEDCDEVNAQIYKTRSGRNNTVARWKKMYAKRFNSYHLQYCPDVDLIAIKDDGTNGRNKPMYDKR